LLQHTWTGNIRELRNMNERAVLIGKVPELTIHNLGIKGDPHNEESLQVGTGMASAEFPSEGVDLDEIHKSIEKVYIDKALTFSNGNETKTAKLVNLKLNTFRYRRNKLSTE